MQRRRQVRRLVTMCGREAPLPGISRYRDLRYVFTQGEQTETHNLPDNYPRHAHRPVFREMGVVFQSFRAAGILSRAEMEENPFGAFRAMFHKQAPGFGLKVDKKRAGRFSHVVYDAGVIAVGKFEVTLAFEPAAAYRREQYRRGPPSPGYRPRTGRGYGHNRPARKTFRPPSGRCGRTV